MPKKSSVLDRIKREISKTSQRGLTMAIIGVYEARTKFSELLDRVAQGERFDITRRGIPVAVIKPIAPQRIRKVEEIVEEIKKFRKRHRLNGLKIKELIEEGRM